MAPMPNFGVISDFVHPSLSEVDFGVEVQKCLQTFPNTEIRLEILFHRRIIFKNMNHIHMVCK